MDGAEGEALDAALIRMDALNYLLASREAETTFTGLSSDLWGGCSISVRSPVWRQCADPTR
jgi:hypothetical protein